MALVEAREIQDRFFRAAGELGAAAIRMSPEIRELERTRGRALRLLVPERPRLGFEREWALAQMALAED
jgi:hypothetical protein